MQFPIFLVDLAILPTEQLRGHPAVCALLDSLQSASMGRLRERVGDIFRRLRGLSHESRLKSWALALARYYAAVQGRVQTNAAELIQAFTNLYDRKEAESMALTLADGWRLEGKAEGIAEGIAEGKVESMMTVLEARFGKIPVSLKKKLNTLRENDRVEKALILAATCNSLKEFQKGL